MKASDYIVEFLIQHKITDIFGYPGGMVTHLMDSLSKYEDQITAHNNYHEQACAMAACGWAEITGLPGIAYATSGPGATNLITGIACAYYDSIPCIFITGQVNTYEQKENMNVRQRGFQETDIVSIVKSITKDAFMVKTAHDIPVALDKAFRVSLEGRPGPVLIDIPMDVFRGEVKEILSLNNVCTAVSNGFTIDSIAMEILNELQKAHAPVILAGHGIALSKTTGLFRAFVHETGIPVVTSMTAVDAIPSQDAYAYGMIGAYGHRCSNYIIDHSDCILSLGSRLDCRQTGVNKKLFAPNAQVLRVDIDNGETENIIKEREKVYHIALEMLMPTLLDKAKEKAWNFLHWHDVCTNMQRKLECMDTIQPGNYFIEQLSNVLPCDTVVTTDVGQNQVWVAQSLCLKEKQRVLFSGGHGAMGYALPCAIGVAFATKKPVVCITGDGGFQMNIQELQTVAREHLPIKIVLLNNHALGMIHHFQEMYFESNYVLTQEDRGFTVPNFEKIVSAYGIRVIEDFDWDVLRNVFKDDGPAFMEIQLPENTYIFPKLGLNKPIHEQEPPLEQNVLDEIDEIFCAYIKKGYHSESTMTVDLEE